MKDVIHELIGKNTLFDVLSSVFGFISAVGWFIECYEDDKKLQLLKKAAILSALVIIAGYVLELSTSIGIISLLVWLWIIERRIKRGRKIEENVEKEIQKGLKEGVPGPQADESDISQILGETSNTFVNAGKCLAENRPMEAVKYLNNCSARQIGQVRYFTYYADAFMMLGKYEWALAKLNAVPAGKLKKKKSLKAVMRRKASCYRNLNRYADELECYDVLLKNNYHPEKYYYQRGRVKVRILEVSPYIASANDALHHAYGTEESFIKSIFEDLDRALQYGNEFGAEILSYKGACYFYQKKYKAALEAFDQSQQQKSLANNLVYLGIYHYQEKAFGQAKQYFTECLDAEADNDRALFYMAQICYQEKNYDGAMLYASKAVSVFPYRDECYWLQGMCYIERFAYGDAIIYFSRAIEIKEKADYYNQRAICYANKKEPEYGQAYKDAVRCQELEDTKYHRFRVVFYKVKADQNKKFTEEEIGSMAAPYADDPRYFKFLGLMYAENGYPEKGVGYYEKAIKFDSQDARSRYNLAIALRSLGDPQRAAKLAEEAISFGVEDIRYFELLLKCYRDLNDTAKEIETQLRLSERRSFYAKLNKKNGDEVYAIGKYEAARSYYKTALGYAENSSPILNNMGCACCCLYQYDEAQSYLEKAITSDSSYYLAYFNLGNCCLCMGDTAEELRRAKEYFRKAQTLNPQFRQSSQMLESMDRKNIRMAIDET
ncbi:tetratricopeptide repeat protein [Lacrimispora sp. 210928-DFI.3.58]|uniref:tetratricopeptide repeat protein n=1 Tax=Lacrimispora sp. 210928-DFI.3.58 TaxID=2883214 RepID=UPI001D07308A|nr:tetratricopeptide repeat protein [Lacrimispora sp. 210928-DFI.3.58]MCB7320373.1 tetratricopeptide repeat protein [Lacrimispora sp. 210928-DFI.3.58]